MKTITVIFGRNNLPFSWVIRLFTWSRWSHCGVIDSTGENVTEATAKRGVCVSTLSDFKQRYKKYAIVEMPVADDVDAHLLLNQEIGKAYDWLAIVSLVARRDWEHCNKWFCSELVAHCTGIFRRDRVGRITPEDLWRISR